MAKDLNAGLRKRILSRTQVFAHDFGEIQPFRREILEDIRGRSKRRAGVS
jgi:hypothetical protein